MRTDQDLLQAISGQDGAAFEEFFERHRDRVRTHLLGMLRKGDAAEDALQETFLRVWLHAEQWDGRGACIGWLLKISTNLALNSMRSQRRKKEVPLEGSIAMDGEETPLVVDAGVLGPEELLMTCERAAMVRRLVDSLPEGKREVIRLVHEEDMEIREVAGALDIPEGTVKSRLHNARKQLAQEWDKLCSEWEEL